MLLSWLRLVVIERTRIHVFTFPHNPKTLFMIETGDNSKGLCEISPYTNSERQLMVFPGHRCGHVQLVDLITAEHASSASPVSIAAHQGSIACIAINNFGTMVATASSKGTLIRVFDTLTRSLVVELRRGADPATLYCINFSSDSDFLCASSDKGTVHIFALKDTRLNRRSTFSKMGFLGQYVDSQWAFANFNVNEDCASICAFGSQSTVYGNDVVYLKIFYFYIYYNLDMISITCSTPLSSILSTDYQKE